MESTAQACIIPFTKTKDLVDAVTAGILFTTGRGTYCTMVARRKYPACMTEVSPSALWA